MRTRSQPVSPGGFVSLDMERAPRRTRSTRSASRGASQEPISQQTTEPSTQPETRSKSQRTVKKTTAKRTTATTAKSQTRKAPKRGMRKTTKMAENTVSEEGQESIDEPYPDTTRTENVNNVEATAEDPELVSSTLDSTLMEPKNSESPPLADSPLDDLDELLFNLPDLGETPCPAWYDLQPEELGEVEYAISERHNSHLVLPDFGNLTIDFELSDDLIAQIDEVLALHDTGKLGFAQVERPEERSAENSSPIPLAVIEFTNAPAVHNTSEQADAAEPAIAGPKEPEESKGEVATSEESKDEVATSEESEDEVITSEESEDEVVTSKELKDEVATSEESTCQNETVSPLAPAVHYEQQTAVEDNSIDELVESLEKLSLLDVVPCLSEEAAVSSTESTTLPAWLPETKLASEDSQVIAINAIPDNASVRQLALVSGAFVVTPSMAYPSIPVMEWLAPAKRVQQRPSTLFTTPIPTSPSSIYEGGRAPLNLLTTERQQSVKRPLAPVVPEEEPELIPVPPPRPSRVKPKEPTSTARHPRRLRGFVHTMLSPIPEERDLNPTPSSRVGLERVTPSRAHHVETLPAPSITAQSLFQQTQDSTPQDITSRTHKKKTKKLTPPKVNRKRAHPETSPTNDTEPQTPYANKRRNLGPPGSTPYARRPTPLSRYLNNAVPYSERLRRRRAESEGRIHRTIFRLPQFVAQTEADRQASETPASPSPYPKPLRTNLDFSAEQAQTDDQVVSVQPAAAQEPSTPEPTRNGWSIRGLLNSVPRSFSRFLPSFSRTPEKSEVSVTQQPSSELIRRTQPSEAQSTVASESEPIPRRRLSEQPPAKRPRNLSYSLFPAPIDRDLWLADVPNKTTATLPASPAPASKPADKDMPQILESQDTTTPAVSARGRDATPQRTSAASGSQKKKRKRSPSPDVIPNPVGASYGMDLDYFYYSSESEDDEAEVPPPQTEPKKADSLAKTALRSAVQSERPASKKVRFDASPEDTPSKRRARATDPYHGKHFIGMGSSQIHSAPTTPTPEYRVVDPTQRPGFIPNKTGTFQLDYDAFSDDSDSSSAPSPPRIPVASAAPETPTSIQPSTPQSAQLPTPRATARPAQPPSTPAKVDEEALARVRSQAEKYKPKTPSGLRTTSRYSSPLTATTPDTTHAPPTEKNTEKFGDDQFAKDAQWLYENCPSGDLRQLVWPPKQSLAESLNVRPESLRILSEIWDDSEVDKAYAIFQNELKEFKKTLA